MSKVFILGIDGAPPQQVFHDWIDDLPNIKRLMQDGAYAEVESSIPPLTCSAWTSISTGKSSGDHGLFEYVYKVNNDPNELRVISSDNIKHETFWQTLSKQGKKSIIFGVPITWPIKPFNGVMVTGFMTPGTDKEYTYPPELKQELNEMLGKEYQIDVDGYRKLSKQDLVRRVYEMTDIHFKSIKYLIQNKEWDLFFGVLIGSDRMNHNFWRFFDKLHRRYEPNEFKDTLREYYMYIDRNLGEILSLLDKDTKIIICSDHGTIRMHNRVNLSDWLIKEGYLVLKQPLTEKRKLEPSMIDWSKTRAYAIGAFEGQVSLNLVSREPQGIVELEDYDRLVAELKEKIRNIPGDDGTKLNTKIFTRKQDYDGEARGIAPDIVVYFDNLQYGCNASLVGNDTLWSPSTAMGSDDAVHSPTGIFVMHGGKFNGKIEHMKLENISDIILSESETMSSELVHKLKLICTIGPSSDKPEILKQLVAEGMDYARINLSHVRIEEARPLMDRLSALEIPTILDTQGKEIRINDMAPCTLKESESAIISDDNSTAISFSRHGIISVLIPGDKVYIDDGKIILQLERKDSSNQAIFKIIKGGMLKKNRVVKLDKCISFSPLTSRDKEAIEYGLLCGINTIALSFADSKNDIIAIKKEFPDLIIIPKIENMAGVLNVDELLHEVETVWIDRYDLGTFIGFEKVPLVQKIITKKCQALGKNVFIASQLLESMISEGAPTRAEVNDIANTVLDGAGGLVLAAETAVSIDPIKSLITLKKISQSIDIKQIDAVFTKPDSEKMLIKLQELGYIDGEPSQKRLIVTKENAMDAVCLSNSAFSPLLGFVGKEDYQSILDNMRLKSGSVWPLPIMLLVSKDIADTFSVGDEISLVYDSETIAKISLSEKYAIDKDEYCAKIFKTSSPDHPGVVEIRKSGDISLAGTVTLLKNPFQNEYNLAPSQVKQMIAERGLKTIVAFHTRNPIHRSHEFLQRTALEHVDGLFVNPVVGKKKQGDFNEKYIIESYKIMVDNYYPKNKVIFSTLATYSRYAGPREAVFTALVRRNHGATHFIVGRDHTGVGNFYGKYDSQKIFDTLGDIGIEIMKFHAPYFCKVCGQYVTEHSCEHSSSWIDISGTEIRDMLKKSIAPPSEFMRPEISQMIIKAIERGEEVFVR
jgi:ATP sulfurylase